MSINRYSLGHLSKIINSDIIKDVITWYLKSGIKGRYPFEYLTKKWHSDKIKLSNKWEMLLVKKDGNLYFIKFKLRGVEKYEVN